MTPTEEKRRLSAFLQTSLDGFYCDERGSIDFARKPPEDHEWQAFTEDNARGGGALLFGRVTYEMMASFWPTPMAERVAGEVAARMNAMKKFVASRTLARADWSNTTLIAGDLVEAVARIKRERGPDIAILGSGSIVRPLLEAGLVDELQLAIVPVALGTGRRLFDGLVRPLSLSLARSRTFANGTVVFWYVPSRSNEAARRTIAAVESKE